MKIDNLLRGKSGVLRDFIQVQRKLGVVADGEF